MAGQLFMFGRSIVPALQEAFGLELSDDARHFLAALLLELGCRDGVPHLLSVLEKLDEKSPMAAVVLGKAHVSEAAAPVERYLSQWKAGDDYRIAGTFILALKRVGSIPETLKESLRARWPEQQLPGLEGLFHEPETSVQSSADVKRDTWEGD
jgi:hypothetical protein